MKGQTREVQDKEDCKDHIPKRRALRREITQGYKQRVYNETHKADVFLWLVEVNKHRLEEMNEQDLILRRKCSKQKRRQAMVQVECLPASLCLGDLMPVGISEERRRGLGCVRTLWNKLSYISESGRAEMLLMNSSQDSS